MLYAMFNNLKFSRKTVEKKVWFSNKSIKCFKNEKVNFNQAIQKLEN
jgi:hypothetical protein